jgi:hypothetical protein
VLRVLSPDPAEAAAGHAAQVCPDCGGPFARFVLQAFDAAEHPAGFRGRVTPHVEADGDP